MRDYNKLMEIAKKMVDAIKLKTEGYKEMSENLDQDPEMIKMAKKQYEKSKKELKERIESLEKLKETYRDADVIRAQTNPDGLIDYRVTHLCPRDKVMKSWIFIVKVKDKIEHHKETERKQKDKNTKPLDFLLMQRDLAKKAIYVTQIETPDWVNEKINKLPEDGRTTAIFMYDSLYFKYGTEEKYLKEYETKIKGS